MTTKKPSRSENKTTAQKRGEKRRKVKLNVASEAARKAPVGVTPGGDQDIFDRIAQ